MTLTIEKIKQMLTEITQGKWRVADEGQTVNGPKKKDRIVSVLDDMCPELTVYDRDELQSNKNVRFIAASPEIVRFLLDRENLYAQERFNLQEQVNLKCENHVDYGSPIDKKLEELELHFQAAGNCMMRYYPTSYLERRAAIEKEIEKEFQRLKSETKER